LEPLETQRTASVLTSHACVHRFSTSFAQKALPQRRLWDHAGHVVLDGFSLQWIMPLQQVW